MDILLRISTM